MMPGRRNLFVAGLALLYLAGCESVPAIQIPNKGSKASCDHIQYSAICDSDLRARFPDVLPTDQILDSDSFDDDWPVKVVINYTPEVIDEHTVRAKHMVCIQYREGIDFDCRLYRPAGYYESHPNDYLVATDSVTPDVAKRIVHLTMTGKAVAKNPDWAGALMPGDVRWYVLDHALFEGYTLNMSTSGCGGSIHIRLDGEGEQQVLRVTGPSEIVCH